MQVSSSLGVSIDELVSVGRRTKITAKPSRPVKKVEARYRNPENPVDTWTGRGRSPKWVMAHLTNGAVLSDLLII